MYLTLDSIYTWNYILLLLTLASFWMRYGMNIHYDLIKKGLLQLIKVDCISLAMLSLIYMYKRNLNQMGQIVQMMH